MSDTIVSNANQGRSNRLSLDALTERVHTQGGQISDLNADTKQNISGLRIEMGEKISRVENLIAGIAADLKTNSLAAADRSRTNWFGLIGTALTAIAVSSVLIGTLTSLRFAPVEDKLLITTAAQTQIVAELKALSATLDTNYVPRKELEGRREDAKDRRAADEERLKAIEADKVSKLELGFLSEQARLRSEANLQRINGAIDRVARLESDIVTKRENEDNWRRLDKQIDANTAERLAQLETIDRQFVRMNAKVDALENDNAGSKATITAQIEDFRRLLAEFEGLRNNAANKIDVQTINERLTVISNRLASSLIGGSTAK